MLWLDQNVGHFLLDLRLWVSLVAKKGPGLCRSTLGIFSINIHNLGDNTPGRGSGVHPKLWWRNMPGRPGWHSPKERWLPHKATRVKKSLLKKIEVVVQIRRIWCNNLPLKHHKKTHVDYHSFNPLKAADVFGRWFSLKKTGDFRAPLLNFQGVS